MKKPSPEKARSFAELYKSELNAIRRARGIAKLPVLEDLGNNDTSAWDGEPLAPAGPPDIVGLCLSGGGIRSATFNLGLLQGLHRVGVLRLFDYLSTVSGGGYIGGWLTAWLARSRRKDTVFESKFPESQKGSPEAREIRHLREFSRFLAPRWGIFEVETGNFIMAAFSAMLPALVLVTAISLAGVTLWATAAALLLAIPAWASSLLGVALLGFWLITAWWFTQKRDPAEPFRSALRDRLELFQHGSSSLERRWKFTDKALEKSSKLLHPAGWIAIFVIAAAASGWFGALYCFQKDTGWNEQFWQVWLFRIFTPAVPWRFEWRPDLIWLIHVPLLIPVFGALAAIVIRLGLSTWSGTRRWIRFQIASDRLLGRLFWLACVLAFFSTAWHAGVLIAQNNSTILTALGSAATATVTALLARQLEQTQPASQTATFRMGVKVLTLKSLARITLFLYFAGLNALVYSLLISWDGNYRSVVLFFVLVASAITAGLILLCFDPTVMSLHAFYRSRIARAFLGASTPVRPPVEQAPFDRNRYTDERLLDDLELFEDVGDWTFKEDHWAVQDSDPNWTPLRPLHLICTAANDVAGDPLGALNRGARSAVLSGLGFSMGNCWYTPNGVNPIRLGAALTASGAAFNPNMGNRSKEFGRAVTFLLAALNLRLGLWIKLQGTGRPWNAFLRELFGLTIANHDSTALHLSDGGHFENLGLYELVRRRCLYILVSDCGADPDVCFDDFGNASRRVREDFGVEIEIDLAPLRPDTVGLSRQHVAVGRILYPGGYQGILLFVKPALTGDEPEDIRQYRSSNTAFPHESTGDQFYDEAQWESYRRLGEHTASKVFAFVKTEKDWLTTRVFSTAALLWNPPPKLDSGQMLDLTSRFSELMGSLNRPNGIPFANDLLDKLSGRDQMEQSRLLSLLQIIQLMEDVWQTAQFEEHWNHTINGGWMDLFDAWASTEAFQRFWPVLKRFYGLGFIDFCQTRFPDLRTAARRREEYSHSSVEKWLKDTTSPNYAWQPKKDMFVRRIDVGPQGVSRKIELASIPPPLITSGGLTWWESNIQVLPGMRSSRIGARLFQKIVEAYRATLPLCGPSRPVQLILTAEVGESEAEARATIFRISLPYRETNGGELIIQENPPGASPPVEGKIRWC